MPTYAVYLLAISLFLSHTSRSQAPSLSLEQRTHFSNFPSCSAVAFNNGKLYLTGDDACHIYLLSAQHIVVDSVRIFNYPGKRIPKKIKEDHEATFFRIINKDTALVSLGSAATRPRRVLRILPMTEGKLRTEEGSVVNTDSLVDRLSNSIREINFEGITPVNNEIVISNRANKSNPINQLVFLPQNFQNNQNRCNTDVITIILPITTKNIVGVSDLFYHAPTDRMFLSFSTELTGSSYDDGKIGDSFLGYVNNFSRKPKSKTIEVDQMINLPEMNAAFKNQKIEGVCVERYDQSSYTLHLTSDDDQGSSDVFKITLTGIR